MPYRATPDLLNFSSFPLRISGHVVVFRGWAQVPVYLGGGADAEEEMRIYPLNVAFVQERLRAFF